MDITIVGLVCVAILVTLMVVLTRLYTGEKLPEPRLRLRRWLAIASTTSLVISFLVAGIGYFASKKPFSPGLFAKILAFAFAVWFVMCFTALLFRDYCIPSLTRSLQRLRSIPFQSGFFFMIWSSIITFFLFCIVLGLKQPSLLARILSREDTVSLAAMFYLGGGLAGVARGIVVMHGRRKRIETILRTKTVNDPALSPQTGIPLLNKVIPTLVALFLSLVVFHARWVWIAAFLGDNLGFNLYALIWSYLYERRSGGNLTLIMKLYVNVRDAAGMTPLMHAAKEGHTNVVKSLLDKGADPDAEDKTGRTALNLAKENGYTEIVQLLKQHGAKE